MTITLVGSYAESHSAATGTVDVSVDIPSGDVEGNLQILSTSHRSSTRTPATPSGTGWNGPYLTENRIGDSNSRQATAWWWRIVPATAGDISSVGWTTDPGNPAFTILEFNDSEGGTWGIDSATTLNGEAGASPGGTSITGPTTDPDTPGLSWGVGAFRDTTVITGAELSVADSWTTSVSANQTGTAANGLGVQAAYRISDASTGPAWSWTTQCEALVVAAAFSAVSAGGATASPTVVAVTATIPAATAKAGAATSPSVVAATAAIPAAVASASGTRNPAVVAVTATIPAAAAKAGASVSPAVVAVTATVPAVTAKAGSSTSPSVVAVTATIPAVVASAAAGGATASPAAVAVTATIPSASPAAGATVSPGPTTITATIPAVVGIRCV